jgi:hypothetical protein
MNHRFATVAIFFTALTYAGFALWLGLNPGALLSAFGIEQSTPQMLTEIRAFYGGVEFAIAAAMLILWWRGRCIRGSADWRPAVVGQRVRTAVGTVVGRLLWDALGTCHSGGGWCSRLLDG